MTATPPTRRPTRAVATADLPRFDAGDLDDGTRAALAELLLSMADDEFVIGFWDSEWTGIAPMLEEDVAFSSLAQDEIGHARLLYEMLAQLTGASADAIAFGRMPDEYRHAALLDHPRRDWAFSVARRWRYDTSDAVRLDALKDSTFAPLAEVVAKIRREERYHLMHMDVWLRRLALGGEEPRQRLTDALQALHHDAASVFGPLAGEQVLVDAGILAAPMHVLAERWTAQVGRLFVDELGFVSPGGHTPAPRGGDHGPDFAWLWNEFTQVFRSDREAVW
jgi:ring-1,2-phenylacetyl-CoA epoxidase subunit PaaC